jgi:hypothetical protein
MRTFQDLMTFVGVSAGDPPVARAWFDLGFRAGSHRVPSMAHFAPAK